MSSFLLDQGLPRGTALKLRSKGWDIAHVGDLGMSQATDSQILDYAREHNHIVITLDADFHALLAVNGHQKPSVIRIRIEGLKSDAVANLLIDACPEIRDSLGHGAVVAITREQVRIRKLPII